MNISFPPIDPCAEAWAKFVAFLSVKMAQDEINPSPEGGMLFDVRFRGRQFTHCPFCGCALHMDLPIDRRHL